MEIDVEFLHVLDNELVSLKNKIERLKRYLDVALHTLSINSVDISPIWVEEAQKLIKG